MHGTNYLRTTDVRVNDIKNDLKPEVDSALETFCRSCIIYTYLRQRGGVHRNYDVSC
jgi:hypothetical protein